MRVNGPASRRLKPDSAKQPNRENGLVFTINAYPAPTDAPLSAYRPLAPLRARAAKPTNVAYPHTRTRRVFAHSLTPRQRPIITASRTTGGTRTHNPMIKSHLLYQLSYRGKPDPQGTGATERRRDEHLISNYAEPSKTI